MTKQFHTDGTPLTTIKKNAKERARQKGEKLSAAQDAIARELGVPGFNELVAGAILSEEDELGFSRVVDGIEHVFDYAELADEMHAAFDHRSALINDLWIVWSVECGEDYPILLNRLECREPVHDAPGTWAKFSPKVRISVGDFVAALDEMDVGKQSRMVKLLGEMGVFNHGLMPAEFSGEHEGLLQIALRDRGINVAERALTQIELPDTEGNESRLFVNKLSDGSFVACDGGSSLSSLRWRLLAAEEFSAIKNAPSKEFHGYAFRSGEPVQA